MRPLIGIVSLLFFGVLKWAFDHFLWDWFVKLIEDRWHFSEPTLIASVSSYVIPALVVTACVILLYRLAHHDLATRTQRKKLVSVASGPEWISPHKNREASKGVPVVTSPLAIELGTDQNHQRIEHFDNGLLRRSIYVAVCNNSDADIHDCNIKLTAATPRLKTGNVDTSYPVFFGSNFDLSASKRKYVKILSFAESGATDAIERDNILISAAVGGWFGGWTTISPLPTQNNPAIITLEAFAPATATSHTSLKIWVDENLGRKLCASVA
jgi:hypothetical protein